MSTIDLKVTLATANPGTLEVIGNQRIGQASSAQTIKWQLDNSLTDASFLPISGGDPGFEWISNPPPDATIFGTPKIAKNGKSLSIRDTNTGTASVGAWAYVLRLIYQGKLYETAFNLEPTLTATRSKKSASAFRLASGNPIIIND